ncbi:MAG: tail fiber domain-containing protein [Candidatus Kapabacteria bacterium]|nr:tail fiber domain-containing protein [Candidatus Kapabacteria bacterium]
MMWYPDKAAFRAGYVTGSHWDMSNIGISSIAMGNNTIASDDMSMAFGSSTVASGYASFAFGAGTLASGNVATAFGNNTSSTGIATTATGHSTTASGNYSFSMGYGTQALGAFSLAMGRNTSAHSGFEVVLGSFSTEYTPVNAFGWSENDRLFVIGNGLGDWAPSNAMTVLKNGKVGIGTELPTHHLDVSGQVRIRGGNPGAGKVLTSDANGTATWETRQSLPAGSNLYSLRHNGAEWVADYFLKNSGSSIAINAVNNNSYKLFVHSEQNTGYGPDKAVIYGYREGFVEAHKGGTNWSQIGIDAAIKGCSYYGNNYTAGIAGYSSLNFTNSAALLGSSYDGNHRGAIGFKDFSGALWAGHFTGNVHINGKLGIGTSSPSALLHLHETGFSGGNVVFVGEYLDHDIHQPPVSGSGTRMMWYPNKAAFRAGRVASTQWNKDNIGYNSVAFGYNAKASGNSSTAMGYETTASGSSSTSMGYETTASGAYSTSLGNSTTAQSAYSVVLGRYNLISGGLYGWEATDPLFVIGNGSSTTSRSNALTVLKNGKTGIGTASPSELLHINNSTGTAKLRVSSASTALSELTFYSGNSYVGAIGSDNANNYFYIYQGGNIIFKNGRIGIQTVTNPTFALHLPNSTSDGIGRGRANAWTTYSDKRIKTATEEIQYGLSEILQLQPVKYFQHNSKFDDGKLVISDIGASDIGFIAQDIFKIIPEIVSVPENENGELWGLNYEKLTPILVKAIQEQQMKIDELERKLEQLLQKFSENK